MAYHAMLKHSPRDTDKENPKPWVVVFVMTEARGPSFQQNQASHD